MQTDIIFSKTRFHLRRYPLQKNEQHQAWDAADEYLISELDQLTLNKNSHVLIFNDHFGALACYAAHKGFRVTCVNDSWLSQQSIKQNAKQNLTDEQQNSICYLSSLDTLPDSVDIALMQLPKSNRFLVWQLSQLAALATKELTLIAGAKVREIHSSTLDLFAKHLGSTKTSLARKKARLIFCTKQKQAEQLPKATTEFSVPEYQLTLANHANVFSSEKLDIAAFLMLAHIPKSEHYRHIIDLGCGNGVLAIQAARKNPQAKITLVDESHMAVASAKMNLINAGIEEARINAVVNNCLDGFAPASADLVLCNPPFHQQHTVTDHIAWQMFCDAKHVLVPKGHLLVIGNRHLGYHCKIQRLFGNEKCIASNAKFILIKAIK